MCTAVASTPAITAASSSKPARSKADIQFVLRDTYRSGETVEVKIKNVSDVSYAFSGEYPACELRYTDENGRKFRIPPGTHCDMVVYEEIEPGETVKLFEWRLDECVKDRWGCQESKSLPPGVYKITGKFYRFPRTPSPTHGPNPFAPEPFTEAVATIRIK
ncbi:MAG: hypothetical protein AB1515_00730 [Nitrospirota bacterium]